MKVRHSVKVNVILARRGVAWHDVAHKLQRHREWHTFAVRSVMGHTCPMLTNTCCRLLEYVQLAALVELHSSLNCSSISYITCGGDYQVMDSQRLPQ